MGSTVKNDINDLRHNLTSLVVVKNQLDDTYRRWFWGEALNKAASMEGYPAFDVSHLLKQNELTTHIDIFTLTALINWSDQLYNSIQKFPLKTKLTVKAAEEANKAISANGQKALRWYFNTEKHKKPDALYRTADDGYKNITLPASDIKAEFSDAVSTFNKQLQKKQAGYEQVFEFYRHFLYIQPFAKHNQLTALLLFYQNLSRTGFIPVPFPSGEEMHFPEWMYRYLMHKEKVNERMYNELITAYKHAESYTAGSDHEQTHSRIDALRKHYDMKGNRASKSSDYDMESVRRAYKQTIYPLVKELFESLEEIHSFFEKYEFNCSGEAVGSHTDFERVIEELRAFLKRPQSRYFNVNFHWRELKEGGPQAFGTFISLQIEKDPQHYYFNRHDGSLTSYTLPWNEDLSAEQRKKIITEMTGQVVDYIEKMKQ